MISARSYPGLAGELSWRDARLRGSVGRYRHAVLTRDTNPLEPHVSEYKLFARDVGLVLTLDVSGGRC